MRIRSRIVNRIIDKADAAFTWSSRILPPPKPTGLRIYGYDVVWTDVAVAVITVLMGIGFAFWYGHWSMFFVTLGVMAAMWLWVF